jgi:uncharacterized protein (UPF0261 family)
LVHLHDRTRHTGQVPLIALRVESEDQSVKTIVVLASLDTKADEARHLVSRIEEKGFDVVLIDIGYGGPPAIDATITSEQVAAAAATDIASVRKKVDTGEASTLMTSGAIVIVNRLLSEGRCDGLVSFGGVSNATVATGVMRTTPVGLPKVMACSAAAMPAYAAGFFGSKDVAMINVPVDFAGLNDLTRGFLDAAAGAVCGMVDMGPGPIASARDARQVAVTGFRFSNTCSRDVVAGLERLGYVAIPFHAQGIGENALEDLISQGLFVGVVDVVPAGLSEQMLGGNRAARPDRLEAAGTIGIPQVIAPSGFDMISCGPLSRRESGDELWESRNLADRAYSVPDQFRVEVRTTAEEVAQIGNLVAKKLNQARGPARVIVPMRGWSSLSTEGEPLYDPAADAAFVPALRETLTAEVSVEEHDLELNSAEFAQVLVDAVHEMIQSADKAAIG